MTSIILFSITFCNNNSDPQYDESSRWSSSKLYDEASFQLHYYHDAWCCCATSLVSYSLSSFNHYYRRHRIGTIIGKHFDIHLTWMAQVNNHNTNKQRFIWRCWCLHLIRQFAMLLIALDNIDLLTQAEMKFIESSSFHAFTGKPCPPDCSFIRTWKKQKGMKLRVLHNLLSFFHHFHCTWFTGIRRYLQNV